MKGSDVHKLIKAFSKIEPESLNGDPISFKGKIVVPYEKDKILKILSAFDAAGDLQVIRNSMYRGISFYLPCTPLYEGTISFLLQDKVLPLNIDEIPNSDLASLNGWCPTGTAEEKKISQRVLEDYGEEQWQKIKAFNEEYCIGNIYARNVGINPKTNKICCFDFQCGVARDKEGHLRV